MTGGISRAVDARIARAREREREKRTRRNHPNGSRMVFAPRIIVIKGRRLNYARERHSPVV